MIDEETKQKIKDSYIKGEGSIQGIANHYRVTVDDVLRFIGQEEILTVQTSGDMIDADDAGNVPINYGEAHKVKYDPS